MPLIAKEGGGSGEDFPLVPEDIHTAVCDMVIDLGLQPGTDLYPDPKRKIYIRWQIPSLQIKYEKDGEKLEGPMVIGKFYTLSLHEMSALRPHLEGWRGRMFTPEELEGFDVFNIIGKACMIQVQHKKNNKQEMKARVTNVIKIPKGTDPPKLDGVALTYGDDCLETYDHLPEFLRKIIDKQIKSAPPPVDPDADQEWDADDDIPF